MKFFNILLFRVFGSQDTKMPCATVEISRRASTLSQDVLFYESKGKVKPSKHLCMGLSMKSLTGSRRIIEILNRLGHSVCYHTTEEIETELASNTSEKDRLTDVAKHEKRLIFRKMSQRLHCIKLNQTFSKNCPDEP